MSKSPAFQFYPKQWLGDDQVLLMDWDARAMHMHFMCIAWQQQPPCTLPDDDNMLRRWVGNNPDWDRIKPQIFGTAWKLVDGRWQQDGLLAEFLKQKHFRETRKVGADERWRRYRAKDTDARALHVECISNALLSSTPELSSSSDNKAKKRPTRIPDSFVVTEEHRKFAREHGTVSPDSEIDKFRDYWKANPKGTKLDWDATFRNWLRNTKQYVPQSAPSVKPESLIDRMNRKQAERSQCPTL